MTTTTAKDRVLSMLELLEAILLEVDLLTLLVSGQRVCQKWHALIHTSPSLQQALYFKPCTETANNQPMSSYTKSHPLLIRNFPNLLQQTWYLPEYALALDLARLPTNKKESFLRKGASWRRMLLSQPPMNVLRLASLTGVRYRSTRLYRHFVIFEKYEKTTLGTDIEAIGKIGEGVHSLHDFVVLSACEKAKQHIFCSELQDAEYIRWPTISSDLYETDSVEVEVKTLSDPGILCLESESDSDYEYVCDNQNC